MSPGGAFEAWPESGLLLHAEPARDFPGGLPSRAHGQHYGGRAGDDVSSGENHGNVCLPGFRIGLDVAPLVQGQFRGFAQQHQVGTDADAQNGQIGGDVEIGVFQAFTMLST